MRLEICSPRINGHEEAYRDNMNQHSLVSIMTRLQALQIEKQGSIPSTGTSSSHCSKSSCRNLIISAVLVSGSLYFLFFMHLPTMLQRQVPFLKHGSWYVLMAVYFWVWFCCFTLYYNFISNILYHLGFFEKPTMVKNVQKNGYIYFCF